jgi:hypothetical protein
MCILLSRSKLWDARLADESLNRCRAIRVVRSARGPDATGAWAFHTNVFCTKPVDGNI